MENLAVDEVKVMEGSRTFALLKSKDPEDQKKAKRLLAYSRKCEKACYRADIVQKLREEYKDVI